MTLDRIKLSAQTVRENIAILEQVEDIEDAGYYLQLEHEKFVLECIERQIPKKPIGRHTSYKCPECDRRVRSGKGSSCRGIDYFCQRCGQALDWGDTE